MVFFFRSVGANGVIHQGFWMLVRIETVVIQQFHEPLNQVTKRVAIGARDHTSRLSEGWILRVQAIEFGVGSRQSVVEL